MAPSDAELPSPNERSKKPYVAPKIIFSELYAKGVGIKDIPSPGSPDYHSTSSNSTS